MVTKKDVDWNTDVENSYNMRVHAERFEINKSKVAPENIGASYPYGDHNMVSRVLRAFSVSFAFGFYVQSTLFVRLYPRGFI